MKNIKTIAIIALCVVAAVLLSRSCGLTGKLRQAKLKYEGYKAIVEADHELSRAHIEQLTNEIALKDEKIVTLRGESLAKQERITKLSTRLDELQNGEPPTTPEIEALPIVVNLRQQVATLTEMFTLAQGTIETKDREIELWSKKYDAQVAISAEWKVMYERENKLRLMGGELITGLERSLKISRLKGKVATVAIVGLAAGYLSYRLIGGNGK